MSFWVAVAVARVKGGPFADGRKGEESPKQTGTAVKQPLYGLGTGVFFVLWARAFGMT